MATAIIHTQGVPNASSYYTMFPSEPFSVSEWLAIRRIEPISPWHFPGLLTKVLQVGATDKEILILSHRTSDGLDIPLVPNAKKTISAQYQQLNVLASSQPVKKKAEICKITEDEVTSICRQMESVRKLKLKKVEVRACNMGGSLLTLEAYQEFFGSGSVGAPDYLDFFGTVDPGTPTTNARDWSIWLAQHKNAQVFKMKSGRVAIHFFARKFNMLADSFVAVKEWIGAYLPASN